MRSGYTAATPGAVVYGAGVLLHEVVGVNKVLGVTRGGVSFDPGVSMRAFEYDGRSSPAEGDDVVDSYAATLTGTFLEASDDDLALYERGAAWTGTTDKTLTPLPVGTRLAAGNYVKNLRWIGQRGDGKWEEVLLATALVESYTERSADKNEREFSVTFAGRVPASAASPDVAPYVRRVLATAPVVG